MIEELDDGVEVCQTVRSLSAHEGFGSEAVGELEVRSESRRV
jgi:hypothetical protein